MLIRLVMNIGVIFTAISGILYGSLGYFGTSLMQQGLSISGLLLWRFLFSSLLLAPFILPFAKKSRREQLDFKVLLQLFVFGAVLYGVGTAFYFVASKSIGTGLAMVIFFAYPIFVVILSMILIRLHLGGLTIVSVVLIIIGCSLIAFGDPYTINAKGILFAVLSGVGYSIYVFYTKQVSRRVHPVLATFTVCLGAAFVFLVYTPLAEGAFPMPSGAFMWTQVALFSLLGTVLPVMLMLLGLKYISANKASIISVLEPVTSLCIGAFVLGESVTGLQFIGALIILSSAILVQLEKEETSFV